MKDTVYITGHLNPDTDSICSSLAYTDYKKQQGIEAVACRVGKISKETQYVLDYYKAEAPKFLESVKIQVRDLFIDRTSPVSKDATLKEAWAVMDGKSLSLPVTGDDGKLTGIITVSDIAKAYINMPQKGGLLCEAPLENIAHVLNARVAVNSSHGISGGANVVIVDGSSAVPGYTKGDIVITGPDSRSQLVAVELGASLVVVAGGVSLEEKVKQAAVRADVPLLVTKLDALAVSRNIFLSVPVSAVMHTSGLLFFKESDYVDAIKEKIYDTRYKAFPVVDDDGKPVGVITRSHLEKGRKKKVILLDHSEITQAVDGLAQAELLEIIDHHRIGDIQTNSPITFRCEPVGCTCTIIANLFFTNGAVTLGRTTAGLLLAAILSDTLQFKSPTCTELDVKTGRKLAEIAGVDIETFAGEMFKAGSSLQGMTPKDIVYNDYKEFNFGEKKIGVGQVLSTDKDTINELKPALLEFLDGLVANNAYSGVMLLITDIIKEDSRVFYAEKDKGVVPGAFGASPENREFLLKGVVSRKKQVVPVLGEFFQ